MKLRTFPKELLVSIEDDGENGYFDATPNALLEASADRWQNSQKIAVYRLVEVKTLKKTVELVK